MKKLIFIALLALVVVAGAVLYPQFISARSRSTLIPCKGNLKNIGTAMEMYSTDWSGKYPTSLSQLTPNYLKTIPDCPTSHEMRYKLVYGPGAGYNTPGFVDYYFVWCDGDVHEKRHGIEKNFPQYDGIHGIIESSSQVEGEPVYIQPAPPPQPKTTKTPEPVATPKGE